MNLQTQAEMIKTNNRRVGQLNRHFENLMRLSKGEHSLKEVAKMAGFEEEKPCLEDGKYCSICGTECEVEFDEDWDEDGFVILPYCYCRQCQEKRYP